MSSYETHAAAPQPTGRSVRHEPHDLPRPGTLTATVAVTALAAVGGLASAVITFADGKSMLESSVGLSSTGSDAGLVNTVIDAAYKTLESRAIIAVVAAIVLIALALAVRGGRTGVRIGLTVALLVAAGVWLLNVRDGGVPSTIRGLDDAALLFSLVAIVLAWLPANGRFAKDRKALRRN
jgi:hypothetical protein